jgi:hypothetical protein
MSDCPPGLRRDTNPRSQTRGKCVQFVEAAPQAGRSPCGPGQVFDSRNLKCVDARRAMYVVAPGDTTSSIAALHGIGIEALLAENTHKPLAAAPVNGRQALVFAALAAGEKLRLPVGVAGLFDGCDIGYGRDASGKCVKTGCPLGTDYDPSGVCKLFVDKSPSPIDPNKPNGAPCVAASGEAGTYQFGVCVAWSSGSPCVDIYGNKSSRDDQGNCPTNKDPGSICYDGNLMQFGAVDLNGVCVAGACAKGSVKYNGICHQIGFACQDSYGKEGVIDSNGNCVPKPAVVGQPCTDIFGNQGVTGPGGICLPSSGGGSGSLPGQSCTDASGNPGIISSNGACLTISGGGGGGGGGGGSTPGMPCVDTMGNPGTIDAFGSCKSSGEGVGGGGGGGGGGNVVQLQPCFDAQGNPGFLNEIGLCTEYGHTNYKSGFNQAGDAAQTPGGEQQKTTEKTDYFTYIAIGAVGLIGGVLIATAMNKKSV